MVKCYTAIHFLTFCYLEAFCVCVCLCVCVCACVCAMRACVRACVKMVTMPLYNPRLIQGNFIQKQSALSLYNYIMI